VIAKMLYLVIPLTSVVSLLERGIEKRYNFSICVFVFLLYNCFVLRLLERMIGRRKEVEERMRSGQSRNRVRGWSCFLHVCYFLVLFEILVCLRYLHEIGSDV
jgi:hypothetical protein